MAGRSIYPALSYRDASAALEWLKDAFGFEEKQVYRSDDGKIQHAEIALGPAIVMLGEATEDGRMGGSAPDPLASPISLYAVVDDPDAHHDHAKAAGASIVRELDDMDYGSREYSARDIEGNLWSFGTYEPEG